jgi:hypothetical protein
MGKRKREETMSGDKKVKTDYILVIMSEPLPEPLSPLILGKR